jgi:hypothetical protein
MASSCRNVPNRPDRPLTAKEANAVERVNLGTEQGTSAVQTLNCQRDYTLRANPWA